jgi:hypothetical protein
MDGFISERNLAQAEHAFPGIGRFFERLPTKPRTFLDLVAMFAFERPSYRVSTSRSGL